METSHCSLLILLISALTVFNTIKAISLHRVEESAATTRLTTADRIRSHGYPVETHKVETVDGFILTVFRIPYSPKSLNSTGKPRPAVLIHHGLRSSSDIYVLIGPNQGLPFLLADAGYDVWLANARGNVYSREHRYLSVHSRRYWEFDWHEMGIYDSPAMIDYILQKNGQEAVHLVGHSQRSTTFVVLLSALPDYNEKVKTVHLMSPVVFCGHIRDVTVTTYAYELGVPGPFSDQFRDREFVDDNPYIQMILGIDCSNQTEGNSVADCLDFVDTYFSEDDPWLNKTIIPALRETHPVAASTTSLVHYTQLYLSNKFRQFDYGREENVKRYGHHSPPSYELDQITASTYIYYSDFDDSVSPRDLLKLKNKLPNLKLYQRVFSLNWSHADFMASFDVRRQVNDIIVEGIDKHEEQENESNENNSE